ncbi:hypothetical protein GCM10009788_07230 [Nocardioides humi]|uniref:Uncharacterized protein n=1 Tax=Nocardioides humi TaxID=449461 RepID=A0ABN1ZXH6_9ACTN
MQLRGARTDTFGEEDVHLGETVEPPMLVAIAARFGGEAEFGEGRSEAGEHPLVGADVHHSVSIGGGAGGVGAEFSAVQVHELSTNERPVLGDLRVQIHHRVPGGSVRLSHGR